MTTTTTENSKCGQEVTYDFGFKTAPCGSSVNGHTLLCAGCNGKASSACAEHPEEPALQASLEAQ